MSTTPSRSAQRDDRQPLAYLGTADFWEGDAPELESEFLAVGSMIMFSVYLRQRGSSQCKPLGTPHHEYKPD